MTPTDQGTNLKTLVAAYERRLIEDALEAMGWHQRRAAARLGLLPTTLHEKMKRLGLMTPEKSQRDTRPFDSSGLPSEPPHLEGGLALASI